MTEQMTTGLLQEVAITLKIKPTIVEKVLKMLGEGNTVHFLARYRKEQIGGIDEEIIREIEKTYVYQKNLQERKETVLKRIDEQGMLTTDLREAIMACTILAQVEQLYEPYKSKKITKAKLAIQGGLEPLATRLLQYQKIDDVKKIASEYVNETFPTVEEVLENTKYLLAQMMSEQLEFRGQLKRIYYRQGQVETKRRKQGETLDVEQTYKSYYEFTRPLQKLANHQVLAINRAEKLKIITSKQTGVAETLLAQGQRHFIKHYASSEISGLLVEALADALKRLLIPSVEREVWGELTTKAEQDAIKLFGQNVYQLLMQKPLVKQVVLGFDPAFRTGCKLAVILPTGDVAEIAVIYPHEPRKEWQAAQTILNTLYQKYHFTIIAIGNGTASRESEAFVANWIAEHHPDVQYAIVSEAGASVYSASKLAIAEFPDYSVEQRSAVSIARRLLDPLSELVKIDPRSLGVGQYQHDLNNKELSSELAYVVDSCVNTVGVDLNIASSELLQYISGLNKKVAENIVAFRTEHGGFSSRKQLLKVKGLGTKAFEQAAGFLRIVQGKEILDNTSIHPESYHIAEAVLNFLQMKAEAIGTVEIAEKIAAQKPVLTADRFETDIYTFAQILDALQHPLRDEREKFGAPQLKSSVTTLDDLEIGMQLEGVVRNITDFGAFIDIGLKNDGFVHISKIVPRFIKHPSEALSIGDNKIVYIENIYPDKNKVELTLLEKR